MTDSNNILLINRDEDFRESICQTLRGSGYTVHTAVGMHDALSIIMEHPVDLIICDSILKDVSGYDFLYYLKSDPLRATIPFLFFVPLNDQGRASKAFQMGVIDFLVYPMEMQDFLNRIREIKPPGATQEDPSPPATPESSAERAIAPDLPAHEDQRNSIRKSPLPSLHIELSRDGFLYMPGRIKNFSRRGLSVETALLGKPGLVLKIRFPLPEENITAEGTIRHVSFDDFQKLAGIGIEMEDSQQWQVVFDYLTALIGHGEKTNGSENGDQVTPLPDQKEKTIILTAEERGESPLPAMLDPRWLKSEETSIESRLYHSLIGKQLDNYKAVSFVGAGNMGGVFKGWDVVLEREVALKVISFELSSKEKFREMFVKEARLISKLDHPNIARIYHIGNLNDILYFAMEYISGGTMADMIREGRNLNTLRGLEYLITICQTLEFVSLKNIIHRDIKPANIMVNQKGTLKIVDFGVAQTTNGQNKGALQEGIVGSPYYMSPDVVAGRPLDLRSDIYSLGACFYHALTATPPFTGKDTDEVLSKHLNENLTPVKEKNPKVSAALGGIVEKMMAKDPNDRYQTYTHIIDEVQALRSRAMKFQQLKNKTLIFHVNQKTG
jgi:DNA-binding response OmpR family regulator/predicted Ser/Thr protein kinase